MDDDDDADDDAEDGASEVGDDGDPGGSPGSSRAGDDVEFVSSDDGDVDVDEDDAGRLAGQSSSSGDSGSDVDSGSDESNTFAALEAQVFQDTLNHLRQLDEQTALQAVRAWLAAASSSSSSCTLTH